MSYTDGSPVNTINTVMASSSDTGSDPYLGGVGEEEMREE